MKNWKLAGLIAAIVIVSVVPLYLLKMKYLGPSRRELQPQKATFVGGKECISCHKKEYDKWLGSDHDNAMELANEQTVKGDFSNAVFEFKGVTSRFYRKDNKYFVHTQGPEGKMADFEIQYPFGIRPLQQYLVPFPGGRLQCLPYAWDTEKKKWFHLYPEETPVPGDWLHWTQNGQTWNSMCAECHSTHLVNGYDPETGNFNTTWSDIDVNCESCHGPGSGHLDWAKLPEMARSNEQGNYGLVVKTSNIDNTEYVEVCARCHSRRIMLHEHDHTAKNLLDNIVPTLLDEHMYFSDGQILDEVYVYGSFVQSKMYRNGVGCNDCHDAHSVKLVEEGNKLCAQCHRADIYDTKNHHFHKKKGEPGEPVRAKDGSILFEVGEGAECIKCHMPGRYYMVNDYRPDHSLRIPRPDLSIKYGTPNACKRCHPDKPDKWSADYITKWYGISRRPHYGTILAAGRRGAPEAKADLVKLARDQLYPVIVRATALSLLAAYPGQESNNAFIQALYDGESLIRHTALHHFRHYSVEERLKLVLPMLNDPVYAVRMEAAMRLSDIPADMFTYGQREVFNNALLEYQKAMEYSGDFSASRLNLGNMYANIGELIRAEENYKMAIKIASDFYPAKINLAMLYNQLGKNDEAESLLREVIKDRPQMFDVSYSLGLLLVEKKQFAEAVQYLEKAARGMPNRARVHYNLGLLLQYLKRAADAEVSLLKALELEPENIDFLYALADHYIKRGKYRDAKPFAQQMVSKNPSNPAARNLLNYIESKIQDN